MKYAILAIGCFLLISTVAYGKPGVTESTDGDGNHVFTVTITAEEYKALQWQHMDPVHWVYILICNIVKSSTERMLPNLTDKRLETLSESEITTLIKNSTLKTGLERNTGR